MSEPETPPVTGLHDLKDAIAKVSEAVGQLATAPDVNYKIFIALLHVLQDHDRRLQSLEAGMGERKAGA